MSGWIKLYRSTRSKGWYQKSEFVHLWVHLLMKANHQDAEFWFNGKNIMVKRGSFVTGRKTLSSETGISESKVERILKCFENEQQIEQQTNNRNRLISIVCFDKYQKGEQQIEQQLNNKRTTSEQPVNTNKNEKNYKNDKELEENNGFVYFENPELDKVFKQWLKMCDEKNKAYTYSSIEALQMKLQDDRNALSKVKQSLENGWVTLQAVDIKPNVDPYKAPLASPII